MNDDLYDLVTAAKLGDKEALDILRTILEEVSSEMTGIPQDVSILPDAEILDLFSTILQDRAIAN